MSIYSDVPHATLNTGEIDTETFDLAKLYTLRSGTYTLMLTLPARVDSSKDTVVSVAPPVVFSVK
jgi:glutathionyl-hydroquinone reductase